jgi:cytochrome c553
LEDEGDVERGREAYASCAVCHQPDGSGHSDGTFPQLAGQHSSVIIKQLVDIREGRRVNPLMLPFANRLSGSQEFADVALYVSLLPRSNQNGKGTGEDLLLGAELYERDCASCHGTAGEGDAARFIPALVGQHYGYMLRQIRDIGAGRRGNAHPEMVFLAGGYSDAELMALVDYASRIRNEESNE